MFTLGLVLSGIVGLLILRSLVGLFLSLVLQPDRLADSYFRKRLREERLVIPEEFIGQYVDQAVKLSAFTAGRNGKIARNAEIHRMLEADILSIKQVKKASND